MNTSEKNQTNRRQVWQIEKMKSIIEERWGEVQIAIESRNLNQKGLHNPRHLIISSFKK